MQQHQEPWFPDLKILIGIGGVAFVAIILILAVVIQSCTSNGQDNEPLLALPTQVPVTATADPIATPQDSVTATPDPSTFEQPTAVFGAGRVEAQGGANPYETPIFEAFGGGGATPIPPAQPWPTQPIYPTPLPTQVPIWQPTPQPPQTYPASTYRNATWCTFDTVALLPNQGGWGGYQVQGPFKGACRPQNTVITSVAVVVDGAVILQNNIQWDSYTGGSDTPWLTSAGITQWSVQDAYGSRCIQWRYDQLTPQSQVQIVVLHSLGQDTYPLQIEQGWRWTKFGSSICAYSNNLQRLRAYYGETPLHWLGALGYIYHQEMIDQLVSQNGLNSWLNATGQELAVPVGWIPNRWIQQPQ